MPARLGSVSIGGEQPSYMLIRILFCLTRIKFIALIEMLVINLKYRNMPKNPFTLKEIASGPAFCNRQKELSDLRRFADAAQNALL
jgi:hypothetical protein